MLHNKFKSPVLGRHLLNQVAFGYRGNIIGDFEEIFLSIKDEKGKFRAYLWYWLHIFRSLPALLTNSIFWSTSMLKNYLLSALRNFKKNKLHSTINLSGLSLGIACCVLIYSFIQMEMSYDRFHEDYEDIYILAMGTERENASLSSLVPTPLGPVLKETYDEIEYAARYRTYDTKVSTGPGSTAAQTEKLTIVDADFFNMFNFPMISGAKQALLNDASTVIVSPGASEKYFGNTDPIGEIIQIRINGNFLPFTIVAVSKEIPDNSSIKFDFLLPISVLEDIHGQERFVSWNAFDANLFVKLAAGTSASSLESRLPNLINDYGMGEGRYIGNNKDGLGKVTGTLHMVALEDYHYDTSIAGGYNFEARGNAFYSFILVGIGFLILGIACINFMNLTISQSVRRAKEIGVRKVLGAYRRQLIKQFYLESIMMAVFSMVFGLIIAQLAVPVFSQLAEKNVELSYVSNVGNFITLLIFCVGVGFIAGTYPAVFLSNFKPVKTLKSSFRLGDSNVFTKSLVVLQFAISVFLVISAITMSGQLNYMQTRDLGYNKENVIVLNTTADDRNRVLGLFKERVRAHPEVVNVSLASRGGFQNNSLGFYVYMEDNKTYNYQVTKVDQDFIETMDITIVDGRNLSLENVTDAENGVIVNETLLKAYEITNPIGKELPLSSEGNPRIIGVVKDFNFKSLHNDIQPLVMHMFPDWRYSSAYLRVKTNDMSGLIEKIRNEWNEVVPGEAFDYKFLDEGIATLYAVDQNWKSIVSYAMAIAILIACLGLYGMASLIAVSRTKEFGIRKVLGASVSGLLVNFNRQFVKFVVAANIIAWPTAYVAMNKWLENFAFKMDLDVSIYLTAAGFSLLVTIITISIHSLRVSSTNPIDSLQYE